MKFRNLLPLAIFLSLSIPISSQIRNDNDRWMNGPAEPFKVVGNIYYVGASDVASYLITTPKGHILLDGGFKETALRIEKNIEKLGFELGDVKILLNNHAHYDHAGGLAFLKARSGAKLIAIREQAEMLERGGRKDFSYGDLLSFTPVKVDEIIKPGEKVKLGGVILKAHFTPGHTKGATTYTMQIKENGKKLRVIFQSSLSALPKYDLIDNPKYPNHAADFKMTFVKLKKMKVDVFLGSHAQFFKMKEKLEMWGKDKSKNPFIDPNGYQKFIMSAEKSFLKKLAQQKK